MKEKIAERASELMQQFGIRTVTMDDISRDLGISKKTIYQYFKDKKELVNTITSIHLNLEKERFEGTATASENSVHELIMVSQCLRESMKDMKMSLMNELQKFYPEAWQMYEDFKKGVMLESITAVIERGQKEGLFRAEVDPYLIAVMRIEQVQTFIMRNLFPREKYSLYDVQMQLFDHFIHGLFTIEGHQLFNDYTTSKIKTNETLN
ncbi:TetR/AcrR family transcriptional regulator [Roseivirga sp. E12]|uniref:TetR/AcrR family transcriptional regulator n=1 Tax=Roseivirga sp. E12 TaxID=2819237 RepID=UPI001ABC6AA2|nr:TetR/AcrR family transcriptional regulator [Roseivirga sp. E12]MBO3698037.1 TetR/AcrR family transcriptional regulator [Roseivirga sp. E12]